MRLASRFTTTIALLIPLAGASCTSQQPAAQPVAAPLSEVQAAMFAREYLAQNSVSATGRFVAQERIPSAWWLIYRAPFDAAARPPQLSYLILVHDDGTVSQIH
jgi:hypothetical protein